MSSPTAKASKRPAHVIEEAVKRHLEGESASVLSKYYKISKPGFYLWVRRYKEDMLKAKAKSGMSATDAETADKRVLIMEIQALKAENTKLRNRVVEMMLHGDKGA